MIQDLPTASREPCEHPGTQADLGLLMAHLGAAYNLARWLMRNEIEAEDVVQDAYLRAISHFAGFRGGDTRAWLLTIVRNSCYSRLKQRAVSGRNTDLEETLSLADQLTLNPETALLLAERTELVRKSMAALPPHYREVLVLRELEHLSYQEIAKMAGILPGTVMSRLSRARRQLEQILLGHTELRRHRPDYQQKPGRSFDKTGIKTPLVKY